MADSTGETEQDNSRRRFTAIAGAGVLVAGGIAVWGLIAGWWIASPAKPIAPVTAQDVRSTLDLDPFLVNLADTESTRFVKVTFRLTVDKKVGQELAGDPVAVAAARDAIISLLSAKTSAQILSVEGKARLRTEVRGRVNSVLPHGSIGEVYIVDFVVQM